MIDDYLNISMTAKGFMNTPGSASSYSNQVGNIGNRVPLAPVNK